MPETMQERGEAAYRATHPSRAADPQAFDPTVVPADLSAPDRELWLFGWWLACIRHQPQRTSSGLGPMYTVNGRPVEPDWNVRYAEARAIGVTDTTARMWAAATGDYEQRVAATIQRSLGRLPGRPRPS